MGTLLTKVFQRAAGWWKAADTALQTILPELTTESVPSRLVRFTPVNVLPVNFSYLKNDGIERLFFNSNKSGTAEVSLLSLKNKRQEFFLPRKCCQADRQTACLHAELSVHLTTKPAWVSRAKARITNAGGDCGSTQCGAISFRAPRGAISFRALCQHHHQFLSFLSARGS